MVGLCCPSQLNHDVLELDKKIASLEVEIYQRGLQRPGALGQGTDSETKTITVAVEVSRSLCLRL